ncbi:alanine racemase [Vagococcus elongatus]|uniref:Alanine racemase n=1 Tax=Vagococcus elongatus TaxID=180344 RepID=A0A430ASJ9_9ENTE|nr:alanine racemase [Vagococcus elongatus]RSU11024.1 alanine racemase [Vagococcus elongatus]
MNTSWNRSSTIFVDSEAIKYNIKKILEDRQPEDQVFAVVKADGYGHGAIEVARAALEGGAQGICVATIDEALDVRKAGFTVPVLVMGLIEEESAQLAQEHDISVTAGDNIWLKNLLQGNTLNGKLAPLKIHLKVDTGMGRIGYQTVADFLEGLKIISASPALYLEGIFTHFATADEADTTIFEQQQEKLKEFLAVVAEKPTYVHCANSATAIWHSECPSDIIRLGLAMYGVNPSGDTLALPYKLKPALSLKSKLIFVKQVFPGDTISYGATYTAREEEWIGTLPIGYADGWHRRLQGFHVLVDGQPCEIVGRVCMDQCMIRLPKEYDVGTEVVLVGTSGTQEISVVDIANYIGTIPYEVLCQFSGRLRREYN